MTLFALKLKYQTDFHPRAASYRTILQQIAIYAIVCTIIPFALGHTRKR